MAVTSTAMTAWECSESFVGDRTLARISCRCARVFGKRLGTSID
jgi:hypothetical protein